MFATDVTISAETLVPLLIAVIGGGGLAAWFTIKPQRESIVAQATKTSIDAVNEVIDTLREQLKDAKIDLRTARDEIIKLEGELKGSREYAAEERARLEKQVGLHSRRIEWLENELDRRTTPSRGRGARRTVDMRRSDSGIASGGSGPYDPGG